MKNGTFAVVVAALFVLTAFFFFKSGESAKEASVALERAEAAEKLTESFRKGLEASLARIDSLRAEQVPAETVFVQRDRFRLRVDTLVLTDTIQVKEALAEADSVIGVCLSALRSCEALSAEQDSALQQAQRLAEIERQRAEALKDALPGTGDKIVSALKWLIAGGVLGALGWEIARE